MATVSTNISAAAPYFDDYNTSGNEDKNYLRVLFKPGVPIQTRELNQLQTALQNQIAKLGSHVFPDNSRVLDGELFVDRGLPSIDVDMASGYRTSAQITSSVIGQTIENSGDTVTAKVIDARNISGNTWKLFLRYTKTTDSETISSDIVFTAPTYESTFETSAAIDIGGANIGTVVSVGLAARYKINPGVYFTKGSFVKVEEQIVYLDTGSTNLEYAAQPILRVVESVANSSSDPSLRDNASGSTNIGAPGADRYKIDLQLKVLTDNPTILGIASNTDALSLQDFSSDAIKLADVQNGNVIEPNDYVYNELGEVLAKRTFEESGNYVVNPFKLDMREHLNTGASRTERGKFTSAQGGDSSLIAIDVEPSVAYVQGKRRETINKRTVELRKARDTFSGIYGEGSTISGYETVAVQVNKGNYVEAANVFGVPDSSATCELYAATSAADSPTADEQATGTLTQGHIGTCKVSSVHFTGTTFKIYISDIAMDAGFELSDANYILEETASTGSIGPSGRADDFTFAASTGDKESGFVLKDVENTQDIFPFGRDAINDVKNLRYGVRSVTSSISLGGAVTSVFLTAGSNGVASDHRFYSTNPNDYIIVKDDGSIHPTGSTAIALSNPDANGEFQQALITFASLNDTIQVMYSARKLATLANGKKTLQTDTKVSTPSSLTKNEELTLSQVDVQSIVSVVHDNDATISAADFKLVSGRTQTSYGTSKVRYAGVNKTGLSGNLTITFLRFNHATTSEPFTVESYNINGFNNTNVSGTSSDYEDICKEDTISNIDRVTDGIDFRATTVTVDPNSIITADINYFLPRHDRLFIDKNGDFVVAEGKSNLDPRPPALPKEALLLYDLLIPAYTFTPRDIDLISAQNKRYTMKDIGTIDERLKAVEYHTALSLLEKDAEGRQIFDNDGLRFNNGILVDNF